MITYSFWPERPYKGLAHYSERDDLLLAGRSRDIVDCNKKLLDGNTAILTLHGRTAAGKSSFLRAGLIPELKKRSPKYEVVRESYPITSLLIRSTNDPLERLAVSIYRFVQELVKTRDQTQEDGESAYKYGELQ